MMPNTPMKDLYNLYRYIQHLFLKSKLDCDDDEFDNTLDEDNWLLQNRGENDRILTYGTLLDVLW